MNKLMSEMMSEMMSRNESNSDRIVRAVLGVLLAIGSFSLTGVASIFMAVSSAVMVVTAVVGFCPLYRVLGITTSRLPDH